MSPGVTWVRYFISKLDEHLSVKILEPQDYSRWLEYRARTRTLLLTRLEISSYSKGLG